MEFEKDSQDDTAMVLRGATYEEALALVEEYDLSNKHVVEIAEIVDPVLKKYGWSFVDILSEAIKRNGVS